MSSVTKKKDVLLYDDVKKKLEGMNVTSNMDPKKDSVKARRLYVTYKDLSDNKSIVYIVRIIKRK